MLKISELKARDVVNVGDGRRLGNIIDIDLDVDRGKITAIILPGPRRSYGIFYRREDLVVPWEKIVRIGHDVILVEADQYPEPKQTRP